ncbi:MAG: PBSX family phage terminase large subunit [Acidobacteria bacterium]|nr:PBSX family phage terminase large subunit [Acidobacteriota bacterium]
MSEVEAQFPEALRFLFEPNRYKVSYGGRGSAKSWSYARALLIQGAENPLRILCAREIQKSIRDSVHRLLTDQIAELGLGSFYEVLETEIRGANGTLFIFSGLASQTTESLKSYEGVDRCWVEEAQSVSRKSWNILIPTIRKPGSEIWVSFNPELSTDETYVRFVTNPPPGSIVCEVNYSDNPWFPEVLEQERRHCELTNKEDYATIWEGKCRTAVIGAIYAHEIDAAVRNGRICNVPYDPRLKVHTVWDLGWNDSMAISFVQRLRSELRVIDYIEDSHKTLDWYCAEINQRRYNWGTDYLPHDGRTKDFKTGKSAEQILKAFGRKVKIVPSVSVEDGIKSARMAFQQTYFDKTKTERLVECLKRYRRSINAQTNEPGAPLHDEFSHGADNYRYVALVADQLSNEDEVTRSRIPPRRAFDRDTGV